MIKVQEAVATGRVNGLNANIKYCHELAGIPAVKAILNDYPVEQRTWLWRIKQAARQADVI